MQKTFGDLASWTNSLEEEPYMAKHPQFVFKKVREIEDPITEKKGTE